MNKIKDILQPFLRKKVKIENESSAEQQEPCLEIIRAHQAIYSNDNIPSLEITKDTPEIQSGEIENEKSIDLNTAKTDNIAGYDTLVEELINIVTEFDSLINGTSNDDAKQVIQMCQYRILESLVKSGLTPIDSETEFNPILHTPIPYSIPNEKVGIAEFIRTGLKNQDKIILKAKVRLNENSF